MGALENLIYGVKDVFATAGAVLRPRRAKMWFRNGFDVTDDPDNDRTIVDAAGGGGGGAVPIASGDSSTETALDDVAVTGGRNLLVGTDATLTNTYKYVTILATTAIDWSPTGTSVMAAYADSVRLHNGRPLFFLDATDDTTVPVVGKLRFPYNGAAAVPLIAVKDSGGADRVLFQWGAGDSWILGDASFAGLVQGSGGYIQSSSGGLSIVAIGQIVIGSPETLNAGTTEGRTLTREDTVKAIAAPATLSTFATTTDAMHVIDAEVIAVKDDGTIGGRWKISQGFLNSAGAVTGDTPDAPAPQFTGGAPAWSIAFNVAGTSVTLDVDPGVDTVTFYVVRSSMRTIAAA